jgi:hypothetical protein
LLFLWAPTPGLWTSVRIWGESAARGARGSSVGRRCESRRWSPRRGRPPERGERWPWAHEANPRFQNVSGGAAFLCMKRLRFDGPDWVRLFETAAGQSAHVTTKQAAEAGYSTHLLRKHMHAGRVTRPQRVSYRLVHFPVAERGAGQPRDAGDPHDANAGRALRLLRARSWVGAVRGDRTRWRRLPPLSCGRTSRRGDPRKPARRCWPRTARRCCRRFWQRRIAPE